MICIYDSTYTGFLTVIFEAFQRKQYDWIITDKKNHQPDMFSFPIEIIGDNEKAARVQKGLEKLISKNKALDFWRAFLSEDLKIHNTLFQLIIHIFREQSAKILQNYGNDLVLDFNLILKKISRERHRMKAFIRFQKSSDGMYVAVIEPDFNVLPLIISFFKNRYADQPWIIYDVKRKYGIHYDLKSISEIEMTQPSDINTLSPANISVELDHLDQQYSKMWQSYFQSTNIEARKNMKLHIKHVPKRYWKYLPEKQYAMLNNR